MLKGGIGKKIIEMGRWKGIKPDKQDRRKLIYRVEEQEEQIIMRSGYYGARVLPTCVCMWFIHMQP